PRAAERARSRSRHQPLHPQNRIAPGWPCLNLDLADGLFLTCACTPSSMMFTTLRRTCCRWKSSSLVLTDELLQCAPKSSCCLYVLLISLHDHYLVQLVRM